jgi:catechol 2,3-dioxygenase-like lactoylglutathione lyase family enzyme
MSAPRPEFRYYYFTPRYDEAVAFYRDLLGLEVISAWDRRPDQRGTIFLSPNGVGLLEVEAGESSGPAGGIYIEMDDVDAWYEEVKSRGVPIAQAIIDTSYGHRQFRIVDPAGLEIGFFSLSQD